MRKVIVLKWERKEGQSHHEKVESGTGLFHGWGVDYEEFESGAGNYSTAIIERVGGTIENVPVEMVKFVEL